MLVIWKKERKGSHSVGTTDRLQPGACSFVAELKIRTNEHSASEIRSRWLLWHLMSIENKQRSEVVSCIGVNYCTWCIGRGLLCESQDQSGTTKVAGAQLLQMLPPTTSEADRGIYRRADMQREAEAPATWRNNLIKGSCFDTLKIQRYISQWV
jgi:hypothetical protein